ERVLLFARYFVLFGEQFRRFSHDHLCQRAEKAVAIHPIYQFLVAQAVAPASTIQIVGKAGHRFGAADERARHIAGSDFLRAKSDGFKAGSTCFVDGVGRDLLRDAAANRDLASHVWAASGLTSVAKDSLFNLLGIDSR